VTAHQGSGPPSVVAAGTPSGNDLLIPRSLLDGLRAEDKRVVAGEKFNWYRLTGLLNDAAGKPLDGWVCETVGVTPWVSPWHWDGYDIIHDYGPLPDGLASSLNLRGLLAEADVERLRPRIDRWDQGSVQSRLYDIIDSNRDGKLAADEIQTALGIPAKAQSISQLVIEYESEWHYRQAKWDDLDDVQGHTPSTPFLNWMAEKERIRELKWWSDVAGRVGLPEGGRVYHLHPVGLVSGFQSMTRRITVELIEKITGKTGDWFTGAGGGRTFYREFSEKYPNVYKFDKSLFVDLLNDSLEIYGIVGAYQQAHFLAQCFHESAHFETTIEFASGDRYNPGNHPDAIKNGNTNAGDGPKYKGKGLIQLTWKKNYRLYSDFKGDDFVISPNLLAEDMHIAIDASCWFWRYNGSIYKKYNANGDINVLVDNEPNNVTLITLAVNGGDNGLPERKRLFESIKKEWDLI
jgi:predicted chitinase